jgi:hypothetical protein
MKLVLLTLISLLGTIWPAPPAANTASGDGATRYVTECGGGKAGAACPALRALLERQLYADLVALATANQTANRAVLRVAARAENPLLASFALTQLAADFSAAEEPIVAAAFASPYPAVRDAARELARMLPDTSRLYRLAQREGTAHSKFRHSEPMPLAPDALADAKRLGLQSVTGAAYSFVASSEERPVFTTSETPDKVLLALGKGKKVLSAAEMQKLVAGHEAQREAEQVEQRKKDAKRKDKNENEIDPDDMAKAMEMMEKMMSGKDPTEMAMEMGAAEEGKKQDWTEGIVGEDGIQNPKFVILEETDGVATQVAAVYRDELLGSTAVALLRTELKRDLAKSYGRAGEDPDYAMRLQMLWIEP